MINRLATLTLALGSLAGLASAACLPIPPSCLPGTDTCKNKKPTVIQKTKTAKAQRLVR